MLVYRPRTLDLVLFLDAVHRSHAHTACCAIIKIANLIYLIWIFASSPKVDKAREVLVPKAD